MIKQHVDNVKLLFNDVGSGSRHAPHAVFNKFSAIEHGGNVLSMIKACDSRMAGYFLASRRLLRLQRTLENMVVSDEWRDLKFVGKAKIERIVRGGRFFNQAAALQQVLLPMLTTLRLADQTNNAMPAFVFFMRKTACSLAQSQELLNNQEVFPAGIGDEEDDDEVDDDEVDDDEVDEDKEEEAEQGEDEVEENDVESDEGNEEDDDEVHDVESDDGSDKEDDVVNDEGNAEDDEDVGGSGGMTTGDGQHVLESTSLGATFTRQWERRSQSLFHPCAVAAWMLCPLPSIMKDSTANCTPEDAAALEEVVKVVTRNHPILGKSPAAVAATLAQFNKELRDFRLKAG